MTPEVLSTLILTSGGLLLAGAAVLVSRSATRTAVQYPELVARVAEIEVRSEANARLALEAHEIATKARRLSSSRTSRKQRAEAEPDSVAHTPELLRGGAPRGWVPGATANGVPVPTPENRKTGTGGAAPVPVEFVD